MITGRTLYGTIESKVDQAQSRQRAAEGRLSTAQSTLLKLKQDQLGIVSKLAMHRALAIQNHDLSATQAVDVQVAKVLTDRTAHLATVQQWLNSEHENFTASQEVYQAAQLRVQDLQAQAAALHQKAESGLQTDPQFAALLAQFEEAQKVAETAGAKAANAASDCDAKLKPYLADPLFRYLEQRAFLTANYRAMPFIASMDGWVAKVCGYAVAKHNFDLLKKLPSFLADHTAKMKDQAAELARQLDARKTALFDELGGQALSARVATAKDALTKAEASHQERRAAMGKAQDRAAEFTEGRDNYSAQITQILGPYFNQETIEKLLEEAAKYPGKEDEELVEALAQVRTQISEQEDDVAAAKTQVNKLRAAADQIRSVRDEFRRRSYNSSNIRFRRDINVDAAVDGFVAGTLTSAVFSSQISSSAYRDDPTPSYSSSSSSSYSSSASFGGFSDSGSSTGGGFSDSGSSTGGGF